MLSLLQNIHVKCFIIITLVLSTLCNVVVAVSNLACGLYNRRLYDQAFKLVEILCRDLGNNCPVSLSVDRVSWLFNNH